MATRQYPYLGTREYNGQQYVVLFSEKDYGTVVMSRITDMPDLAFGAIGDYDEDTFEKVPDGKLIFLTNGGIPDNLDVKFVRKDEE